MAGKMEMEMNKAIDAYLDASNATDITEAYIAMLEWSEAAEDSERDDVDAMLDRMGYPSLSERLAEEGRGY